MANELTKRVPPGTRDPLYEEFRVGDWAWVTIGDEDGKRRLMCATHIGSNFVQFRRKVRGGESSWRVHFDDLDDVEWEPDHRAILQGRATEARERLEALVARVQEITAELGISTQHALPAVETQALVRAADAAPDFRQYREALVVAGEKGLPALYEDIKKAAADVEHWMLAETVGLSARQGELKALQETIQGRVLNVDLYAGLTEDAVKVREGPPALRDEPVHLLQRRCYMDEECLARYEAGGMDYRDVGEFDEWLARDENLHRLLPFKRSVVAFRIRRYEKERATNSVGDLLRNIAEADADKKTFLYVRNGEQLWRLDVPYVFGERLFPDIDGMLSSETRYLYESEYNTQLRVISEREYEDQRTAHRESKKRRREWKKANPGESTVFGPRVDSDPAKTYVPLTPKSVYYDDGIAYMKDEATRHNRLVLILQGLLDRSEALHPHPPWKLWDQTDFQAAVRLVYDADRVVSDGAPPPDFEAYRARLNASLKAGSVTVGQQSAWEKAEREKNGRWKRDRWEDHLPYGNPGPGRIARVTRVHKDGRVRYSWFRERQTSDYWAGKRYGDPIRTHGTVGVNDVLNLDAYQPGDIRQFFDDPHTRQDYLKWAPLLIFAEEYAAGNLKPDADVAEEDES